MELALWVAYQNRNDLFPFSSESQVKVASRREDVGDANAIHWWSSMLGDGEREPRGVDDSGTSIGAKTLRGRKRSSGDASPNMPSKSRSMRGGPVGEVDKERLRGELDGSPVTRKENSEVESGARRRWEDRRR